MAVTQYVRSWAGGEASPTGVRPRFYTEAVQDEYASQQAGHPVFREEERVEIWIPGNMFNQPVHKVRDEHRNRWPAEYRAFLEGREISANGIPIEEWPILNKAQIAELKALNFKTVEDIANVSDANAQNSMGMQGLKARARAYLDSAEEMAQNERLSSENDSLRLEIATLRRQVEEIGEASRRQFAELMALKNAPNPIATTIPGMVDPIEAARMQGAGDHRDMGLATSSLAAFAEVQKRGPGRPRKDAA